MYTVGKAKEELYPVIHGTNLNKLSNILGLFNRAARKVLSDLDPKETQRTATLSSPVYSNVYQYPIPQDVKDDVIYDIYPTGNRTARDKYDQRYLREFSIYKQQGIFSIKNNSGTKFLELSRVGGPAPMLVNQLNSDAGFTPGGDATNITTNSLYQIAGGKSIQFDLSGLSGNGYIETTTQQPADLSSIFNDGALFLYTYLPTGNIYSITVQVGSSSSDYYEGTATTQQNSVAFSLGWNLTSYLMQSMSVTGNPDISNITFVRIEIEYPINTTISGVRVNNLTAQLGEIFEIGYYSKYLFRTPAGVWKEEATEDSDIINLDTTSYNIFFNCLTEFAQQQLSGQPANFDIGYFGTQYINDVRRYKSRFKSERIKPQGLWYRYPNNRRRTRRVYVS